MNSDAFSALNWNDLMMAVRREELAVNVHFANVFEDSFHKLYRRNLEEWKNRLNIVFEDEELQDAGNLLRKWYTIVS